MKKLLFVYNSDWSVMGLVREVEQKIIRPGMSECKLCSVTYKGISKRKTWKNFLKKLHEKGIEVDFVYRNNFIKDYPKYKDLKLPLVAQVAGREEGRLEVLVSSNDFIYVKKVSDLIELLEVRFL